jgi:hypothetical protein
MDIKQAQKLQDLCNTYDAYGCEVWFVGIRFYLNTGKMSKIVSRMGLKLETGAIWINLNNFEANRRKVLKRIHPDHNLKTDFLAGLRTLMSLRKKKNWKALAFVYKGTEHKKLYDQIDQLLKEANEHNFFLECKKISIDLQGWSQKLFESYSSDILHERSPRYILRGDRVVECEPEIDFTSGQSNDKPWWDCSTPTYDPRKRKSRGTRQF